MIGIPENVCAYKKTPLFTQETVPKGLLADHNTKAGVWGKLHVLKGKLGYVITQPGQEFETIIKAGETITIIPEQKHCVSLSGEVEFFVEFYK